MSNRLYTISRKSVSAIYETASDSVTDVIFDTLKLVCIALFVNDMVSMLVVAAIIFSLVVTCRILSGTFEKHETRKATQVTTKVTESETQFFNEIREMVRG